MILCGFRRLALLWRQISRLPLPRWQQRKHNDVQTLYIIFERRSTDYREIIVTISWVINEWVEVSRSKHCTAHKPRLSSKGQHIPSQQSVDEFCWLHAIETLMNLQFCRRCRLDWIRIFRSMLNWLISLTPTVPPNSFCLRSIVRTVAVPSFLRSPDIQP